MNAPFPPLRAIIFRPSPPIPTDLAALSATAHSGKRLKKSAKWDTVGTGLLGELHTKLYLYIRILESETKDFPPEVVAEIKAGRSRALVLLLHAERVTHGAKAAMATAQAALEDALADGDSRALPASSREFLVEELTQLVLDGANGPILKYMSQNLGQLTDDELPKRVVQLATVLEKFASDQPQKTIPALRRMTTVGDPVGVAAWYALAHIYGELKLPHQELDCYKHWLSSMVTAYSDQGTDIGQVVGALSAMETGNEIERGSIKAIERYVPLLHAADQNTEANRIVNSLEDAGFPNMGLLRVNEGRDRGYQIHEITKSELREASSVKDLLYKLLVGATKQSVLLVVKEDYLSEGQQYSVSPGVDVGNILLDRLAQPLAPIGIDTVDEVIIGSVMDSRQWIACYERSDGMNALAIAILRSDTRVTVSCRRAILFNTRVNKDKDADWFERAFVVLSQPFDIDKQSMIQAEVAKSLEKLTPTGTGVQDQYLSDWEQ